MRKIITHPVPCDEQMYKAMKNLNKFLFKNLVYQSLVNYAIKSNFDPWQVAVKGETKRVIYVSIPKNFDFGIKMPKSDFLRRAIQWSIEQIAGSVEQFNENIEAVGVDEYDFIFNCVAVLGGKNE